MSRRSFLCSAGAVPSIGSPLASTAGPGRLHIVTLSFDDGFRKSFARTAAIYEKFGLSACFNIIASAHMRGNLVRDDYMRQDGFGDFALWNELQSRGHEIGVHGYQHANKARMPFEQARQLTLKALDVFSKELRGFDAKKAMFNFPYNESTPELEAWLPSVVMAFRTRGPMIDAVPGPNTVKVGTGGFGPGNCEEHLDAALAKLLEQPRAWLVYNLHGLDDEGWGPIRASYLEKLLGRLKEIDSVRILPAARVLTQAKAGALSS